MPVCFICTPSFRQRNTGQNKKQCQILTNAGFIQQEKEKAEAKERKAEEKKHKAKKRAERKEANEKKKTERKERKERKTKKVKQDKPKRRSKLVLSDMESEEDGVSDSDASMSELQNSDDDELIPEPLATKTDSKVDSIAARTRQAAPAVHSHHHSHSHSHNNSASAPMEAKTEPARRVRPRARSTSSKGKPNVKRARKSSNAEAKQTRANTDLAVVRLLVTLRQPRPFGVVRPLDPSFTTKPRDQEFTAEVWVPEDPSDLFSAYAPAEPPQQERLTLKNVLYPQVTLTNSGYLPIVVKSKLIETMMHELEDFGMWDD